MKVLDGAVKIQPAEAVDHAQINKAQVYDLNIPKHFFYVLTLLLPNLSTLS
jgi:hypothetical protein